MITDWASAGRRPARRSVGVGRRLLIARPVRAVAGALGIGLALLMILVLDGLWAGMRERVTTFEDHSGAQLAVVDAGTQSLFAEPSVLPFSVVDEVAAVRGVSKVSGVRTTYSILELHGGKAAVALVGFTPGGLASPWELTSGRLPGEGEVVVDSLFADKHGLVVGSRLPVLGGELPIVGLTAGTAMFMTPLVFTTEATLTGLLRAPGTTGAVLVATRDPIGVADRLRTAGYNVRTVADLREGSLAMATRIYGGPVRLMIGVAFAAGVLIVALVAYTLVAEHRRDFGLLKALGATPGRLRRLALMQTMSLTALGAGVAVVLLLVARVVIGAWRPELPVSVTGGSLVRAALAAVGMAALAAWVPARHVTHLDAAAAFRSQP
ncbi:MAG: ABC transporter permease [Phycicoccus sp.]|nr:ABC transporter permease [Phycicoccus sp.]